MPRLPFRYQPRRIAVLLGASHTLIQLSKHEWPCLLMLVSRLLI